MNDVTPLWKRRPEPKEDPLEKLRDLVEEYTAATRRERNYGSDRFAHLFWCYLTDLRGVLEQRQADYWAEMEAAMTRRFHGPGAAAAIAAQRKPRLRPVKD